MGKKRRSWNRKQLVHEVEEVTITTKKRKTYVFEDTIAGDDERKDKSKRTKPPLITDYDYGRKSVKDLSDDDSDFPEKDHVVPEDEENDKGYEVHLDAKKIREFRCNSFTVRYVFCKKHSGYFFNAVDVIQCIRETRPYSGVYRIIQPMLKEDTTRYLTPTGKTKLYLSYPQFLEVTAHYLNSTYRYKADKTKKINKLLKQAENLVKAGSKKQKPLQNKTADDAGIADYEPIEEQPEREVINIEDLEDDSDEDEMPASVSGFYLVPKDAPKRFLIFQNNEVLEYVVCDDRSLFKSGDIFTFLFSKDGNATARDKIYQLFESQAENVLFVSYRGGEGDPTVYFTISQTLCMLNFFLCQEVYQNVKSIFHRMLVLKILLVNHAEKE